MNEHTPQTGDPGSESNDTGAQGRPEPGQPHPEQGQPRQSSTQQGPDGIARFFGWIRRTGIVRSDDRWFTGVAGGIAAKAGIDPIIVRGIFVVLAVLGGPGILLYLAAWLLLPDSTDRIHAEEVVRGRSSTGVIVAVVLLGALVFLPVLFGMLPGLFVGSWGWNAWGVMPDWLQLVFGILWWAVIFPGLIVWLIIWLSRRSGGTRPSDTRPSGTGGGWQQRAADQAQQFSQQAETKAHEWSEQANRAAEDWSRKAEQKSHEWEQKAHAYHERHRLGAGYVAISLALALLAGGAVALIALSLGAETSLMLTLGLAAATALLALSMIVAGIRGRDSGWIGFLAVCGTIALVFAPYSTMLPADTEVVPFGTSTIRPWDEGEERALVTIAGNTTVDLSDVSRASAGRSIEVWQLAGTSTVIMPSNAPTSVRVEVLGGSVQDERANRDQRQQGGVFLSRTFQQNVAGVPEEDVAKVQIRLLGGSVAIER